MGGCQTVLWIGTLARSDRTNLAPCSRVRLEKRYPVSDSKAKKYTLIGGTSPYGTYIAVPPPPGQSHVQCFVFSKKIKYFVVVAASFSKSYVFVCLHETGVTENDNVFKFFHFGERFQIFPESPKTIPSFSSFPCKQEAKTEKYFCGFVDSGLV